MEPYEHTLDQLDVLSRLAASDTWYRLRDEHVSGWSVGEHTAHVALSLTAMGVQILRALKRPDEVNPAGPNELGREIISSGIFPRRRAQAPDPVVPKGPVDPEQLTKLVERARDRWSGIEDKMAAIRLSKAVLPHSLLGDFTASDWLRFAPIHTRHHLMIIREIFAGTETVIPEFLVNPEPDNNHRL